MPRRLHIRLDRDIDQGIDAFAEENGLTTSQAARELLRQALTSAEPVDRGWREGYMQGLGQGNRDFQLGGRALKAAKPTPFFAGRRR